MWNCLEEHTDVSLKNIIEEHKKYIQISHLDCAAVGLIKGHYSQVLLCSICEEEAKDPASHGRFNAPSSALVYLTLAEWAR